MVQGPRVNLQEGTGQGSCQGAPLPLNEVFRGLSSRTRGSGIVERCEEGRCLLARWRSPFFLRLVGERSPHLTDQCFFFLRDQGNLTIKLLTFSDDFGTQPVSDRWDVGRRRHLLVSTALINPAGQIVPAAEGGVGFRVAG